MIYDYLSQSIRKFIYDKGWATLRPIQAAAIQHIFESEKHIILAAHTASGKTEAAFLPILSKVDFSMPGIRVLYISPLIALINDQFGRVEELCDYLSVPVTKWHGEANRSLKKKVLREPKGVILITPESLEAMLDNAPQNARHLFTGLDYVIIDEIHAFSGTDRGIQLKSILSRIRRLTTKSFRIVGLSATLGSFDEAKRMTGSPDNTIVLRDKTRKSFEASFRYYSVEGHDLPKALIEDLYQSTKDHKVLIFPNSRGLAEEIAVRLKKISNRLGGHPYYFSHHSSVNKELREYTEHFAKENKRYPFAISCTSTLELGIDIGSVDLVVQVDAAHSVASLIQRTGRSGRGEGESSRLLFFATDPWSLLQSLACLELHKQEFVEPFINIGLPFDILAHQLLALVKQNSACTLSQLEIEIQHNHAFDQITKEHITSVIQCLLKENYLELINNELIIGVEAERIVNSKEFYAMFSSEPAFKVYCQAKAIGEIPFTSLSKVGDNILLAARIWKVIDIDYQSKKIAVTQASDGKKPEFTSSAGVIHPRVRAEMLSILYSDQTYIELNETSSEALEQLRNEFKSYPVKNLNTDRPLLIDNEKVMLFTFQGTLVNRSLKFLLDQTGIKFSYLESKSCFELKISPDDLLPLLNKLLLAIEDVGHLVKEEIVNKPILVETTKWGFLLPLNFQVVLLINKHYNFIGLKTFLNSLVIIFHENYEMDSVKLS